MLKVNKSRIQCEKNDMDEYYFFLLVLNGIFVSNVLIDNGQALVFVVIK